MKRLAILALAGLLTIGLALPAAAVAAPPARNALLNDIPVTGVLENGDPFTGTLDITQVTRDGSTLLFDGALTDDATGGVQQFADLPGVLQQEGPRCNILLLDLGPLHLDLLGLVVDLDEIHLDIHALPGRATCSATCCAPLQNSSTARSVADSAACSTACWIASTTCSMTFSGNARADHAGTPSPAFGRLRLVSARTRSHRGLHTCSPTVTVPAWMPPILRWNCLARTSRRSGCCAWEIYASPRPRIC